MVRDAFGEPAARHEDERGAVLGDVGGDLLVDVAPGVQGGDGAERLVGDLDREIEWLATAGVDQGARPRHIVGVATDEEAGSLGRRLDGGGQADTLEPRAGAGLVQ